MFSAEVYGLALDATAIISNTTLYKCIIHTLPTKESLMVTMRNSLWDMTLIFSQKSITMQLNYTHRYTKRQLDYLDQLFPMQVINVYANNELYISTCVQNEVDHIRTYMMVLDDTDLLVPFICKLDQICNLKPHEIHAL